VSTLRCSQVDVCQVRHLSWSVCGLLGFHSLMEYASPPRQGESTGGVCIFVTVNTSSLSLVSVPYGMWRYGL
jgi:hypothetical protein